MFKSCFILLLAFMFISIGSMNVNAQTIPTPNCYGYEECGSDDDDWTPWVKKVEYYVPPMFPQCTLVVDVWYRQCISNPYLVEVLTKGISSKIDCRVHCTPFWEWLVAGDDPWEFARRARILRLTILREIALRWYEDVLANLPPGFDPNYCDQPDNTRYKIIAFMGSCMAACLTQYPISDPTEPKLLTYSDCTEVYCCRWIQGFCVNRGNGNIVVSEETETDLVGDCNAMSIPITECPPGANVFVSDCIDSCAE